MATVMKASEFVAKLKNIAENYNTLYVYGCFGAPMTAANKKRYIAHADYNAQEDRAKLINAATTNTFGFDCVNLIKGVLWGWNGDKKKTYGGAKYAINDVPDISADQMFKVCGNPSTNFDEIEVGEAVWTKGHIGVYIGDGLAIECTPKWKNKVQITACNCKKAGYYTRTWKKHGKLPYIDYTAAKKPTTTTTTKKFKVEAAQRRSTALSGEYKVTATALHIRTGAGSNKTSMDILKKNTVVTNYGYYNLASNGVKWLYVQLEDGTIGYCSSTYLKKC